MDNVQFQTMSMEYYQPLKKQSLSFLLKCGPSMAVFKEIPGYNNPIEFYRIFVEYLQWEIVLEFNIGEIG